MSTAQQDKEFSEVINDHVETTIAKSALDAATNWVGRNLQPEDVFSDHALQLWAQSLNPDDVFTEKQLESWADSNGYVKE